MLKSFDVLDPGGHQQHSKQKLSLRIISNITVYPLVDVLQRKLALHSHDVNITLGQYGSLVQESFASAKDEVLIVFWELSQLTEFLCYKADLLDNQEVHALISQVKNEIDIFMKNIDNSALVILNRFSCLGFKDLQLKNKTLLSIETALNQYVEHHLPVNVKMIDITPLIEVLGVNVAFDWRFFMFARSLYTQAFFDLYSNRIMPILLGQLGSVKKAIIFDCDNTLWGGIVGECGMDGIQISFNDKKGIPYAAVQVMARSLASLGIIIGVCSKNNPEDVDEVFKNHPDSILKDDDISIKMVNWSDKVSNLISISEKLNISLSSIVYIDDSSYEVEWIRQALPDLTVLQVPENRSEYPTYFSNNIQNLFSLDSYTGEDLQRKRFYKDISLREQESKKFTLLEDYLVSLNLKMSIYIDRKSDINRAQQLCQRTNQFNLTTKRYTTSEIKSFMNSEKHTVLTFALQDKFGDYGISGLAILEYSGEVAIIDTFLMSCRVIGRKAEFSFLNAIIDFLKDGKYTDILGQYVLSDKNIIARDFYKKYKMLLVSQQGKLSNYQARLSDLQKIQILFVGVKVNDEF
jgi:FkbH-like protein